MSKFAKTLKKNFLPVLIARIAIMVINIILGSIYELIARLVVSGSDVEMTSFTDYLSALSPKYNWFDTITENLKVLIVSPFYIGVFRFLFRRLEGDEPKISSVFEYYRSAKRFIGAFAVRVIGTVISPIVTFLMSLIYSAAENPFALYVVFFINLTISVIAQAPFWLAVYEYAKTPENGVFAAFKSSVMRCLKSIKPFGMFCAFMLFALGISYLQNRILLSIPSNLIVSGLLQLAETFLEMWAAVTAAYLILYKAPGSDKSDSEKADNEDVPNDDEEPFIKPYDFYIEADERYDASKAVETEDIRALDPLEILESMELCYDVINNYGVRRKLKRLFDDLAFEVGEYVTYEGGRSVSGSVTEEIDDRELEISVEIIRNSDSEPFIAAITVESSEAEM